MNTKDCKEFLYLEKKDYDKKVKINEEALRVYSRRKLKALYPAHDYAVVGETYDKKKRNRAGEIGRIELNEKRLPVGERGKHNKLLKKEGAFLEIKGGGYIAILKLRFLPILLLLALLLGTIGGALYGILGERSLPLADDTPAPASEIAEPDIRKAETEILTVSGNVSKDGQPIEDAVLSLQTGSEETKTTTTDSDGNYLFHEVTSGNYNLVCSYEDSTLTKIATVSGLSVAVDVLFPSDDLHDVEAITDFHEEEGLPAVTVAEENTDVKATVKVPGDSPSIAVGGLEKEAMLHMVVGKEVDLTLFAERREEGQVSSAEREAITSVSGELELTYFDFRLLKEVYRDKVQVSSEYLTNAKTVLEIAVPYDSSMAVGTYVFRCQDGTAVRLEELSEKPLGSFRDGTYYVTADTVYIYTDFFTLYVIGSASSGHVVKGSDTITYSDKAIINLKTQRIEMYYQHDMNSTNDVRIELYLVGENSNLLIARSDVIPVGYEIGAMTLLPEIRNMPSVGTYNGLMKIIYLDTDGDTNTNVDIPLSIAITQ